MGGCVDEGATIAAATLLMLRALIEKSLVRAAGPGRYDMHELIRQYAADRLDSVGQAAQARRRRRNVYLALAAQLDSQLYGPDGIAAFGRQRYYGQRLLRAGKGRGAQSRRYLHESLSGIVRAIVSLRNVNRSRWNGEIQRELRVCLETSGLVEIAEGNVERALTLFSAATSLACRQTNKPIWGAKPESMSDQNSTVVPFPERCAKAWETGQTMSLERVLAYALGE